jgi:integrase/recombinase XerD
MDCHLRTLLKFLCLKNFISSDLSAAIPRIAVWRLDGIPDYLTKKELKTILNHCDRKTLKGLRDYTIIRILSSLGLRAFEVAQLTLEDIDWENGEITIKGKGLRISRLPLMQDIGEDIVAYLMHGRPSCASRSLFLSVVQPFDGLKSRTISTIVGHAFRRANIHKKGKAHLLRHSLARFLLNAGASLQEVGDILRHKSINTTAIYAKVDFNRLKSLALPWPNINLGGIYEIS